MKETRLVFYSLFLNLGCDDNTRTRRWKVDQQEKSRSKERPPISLRQVLAGARTLVAGPSPPHLFLDTELRTHLQRHRHRRPSRYRRRRRCHLLSWWSFPSVNRQPFRRYNVKRWQQNKVTNLNWTDLYHFLAAIVHFGKIRMKMVTFRRKKTATFRPNELAGWCWSDRWRSFHPKWGSNRKTVELSARCNKYCHCWW